MKRASGCDNVAPHLLLLLKSHPHYYQRMTSLNIRSHVVHTPLYRELHLCVLQPQGLNLSMCPYYKSLLIEHINRAQWDMFNYLV